MLLGFFFFGGGGLFPFLFFLGGRGWPQGLISVFVTYNFNP